MCFALLLPVSCIGRQQLRLLHVYLCCVQVVFVAATKVDLPGRKVPEAEGRAWALAHNMPYYEVGTAGSSIAAAVTCMHA